MRFCVFPKSAENENYTFPFKQKQGVESVDKYNFESEKCGKPNSKNLHNSAIICKIDW